MFKSEDISKAIQFITTDIWRIRAGDLSRKRSFWIRFLRILILTIRGIVEDRWHLRASALTYYSLLSIVPVVAMIFGIAKGFGFEKALEKVLYENLEGQEQEEGAQRMRISRPTFQRILASAREKIADALLHGKAIRIEGGNFEMAWRSGEQP